MKIALLWLFVLGGSWVVIRVPLRVLLKGIYKSECGLSEHEKIMPSAQKIAAARGNSSASTGTTSLPELMSVWDTSMPSGWSSMSQRSCNLWEGAVPFR